MSGVRNFIHNRKNTYSVTNQRIKKIIYYFIECHQKLLEDQVTYSLSAIKKKSTISPEDYYSDCFVDDYLKSNLKKINNSTTEYTVFARESTERYFSNDGTERPDKIDIKVTDKALKESWGANDEVYFTLECKRIETLTDSKKYVGDIKKFTARNYRNIRLPFEGQIAYIENSTITNEKLKDKINADLQSHESITTESYLASNRISNSFEGSFLSSHYKGEVEKSNLFSIYHLFFDYSQIVVE